MVAQGFLLTAIFLLIFMAPARSLGSGLARLTSDIPLPGTTGAGRVLLSAPGVSNREINREQYLSVIFGLNILELVMLFFMLLGQHYLPFDPQQLSGLSWDLVLNTAVNFVTGVNWQSYSGETMLSHFSQMTGLMVQDFLSAASGIAVTFVPIRTFTHQSVNTLGNAWADPLRATLRVLTPVAPLIALFFIQQGALQSFLPYQAMTATEGAQQLLPMRPVASQGAIKMLGTNGNGFFNANLSHPFENPTTLANFVQMLAIFLIPIAPCFASGGMASGRRQGHMLLWVILVIFIICVDAVMWAETQDSPHLLALGADSSINMEDRESRFSVLVSSLSAVVTTTAPCGVMITIHDSFTVLGGMVSMRSIQIGEMVFGSVGPNLYGMMLLVLLTVFIAGLMIGRTPEYLGKKIDVCKAKLTALAILVTPTLVSIGTALAMMTDAGRGVILNPDPHGFNGVLYTVSSAANNSGNTFAGLSANSPLWNCLLALCMLVGRFGVIIPMMVIVGSLVSKKSQPAGSGTLPMYGLLSVGLLTGTVLLVGALAFIPALVLGPVAEYLF